MGSASLNKNPNQLLCSRIDDSPDTTINSLYFEVHSSEDFGRYLVAKEDIDEKTLILSETPLLYGPSDDKDLITDTVYLYCLSCCRQLTKTISKADGIVDDEVEKDSISHLTNGDDDGKYGREGDNGVNVKEIVSGRKVNGYNEGDNDDEFGSAVGGSQAENVYFCSKCGWPVCDKYCEVAPVHSENECKFFTFLYYDQSTIYPPPNKWLMYKSVMLLRLLLLIHKNPQEVFHNFLEKLEHHTETRESKSNCVKADDIVLENLKYFTEGLKTRRNSKKERRKYNLPYLDDEVMLKRFIGTMNVNAFCANNDASKRIARCMFTKASLFAHSCAPNCAWTIEMSLADPNKRSSSGRRRRRKNGYSSVKNAGGLPSNRVTPQIQVYSAIPIKKGELVTIPYSTRNLFYGTLKRQLCMETVGHFICKCERCLDPTECGTFMSAIRCFRCEKGFLITSDAKDEEAPWICVNVGEKVKENTSNENVPKSDDREECVGNVCDYKCSIGKVVYFTTIIQDQIDWILSQDLEWELEQDKLQRIYEKYCGTDLHKNHYLLHEISTKIVETLEERLTVADGEFSQQERLSHEKRKQLLNRYIFHLNNLKRIAEIILPGFNCHQSQLRYYQDVAESLQNTTEE